VLLGKLVLQKTHLPFWGCLETEGSTEMVKNLLPVLVMFLFSTADYYFTCLCQSQQSELRCGRELVVAMSNVQTLGGAVASPWDSWLTLRGMRTLHVRVERQCRTTIQLVQHLEQTMAEAMC
jgi:hypothetical protein